MGKCLEDAGGVLSLLSLIIYIFWFKPSAPMKSKKNLDSRVNMKKEETVNVVVFFGSLVYVGDFPTLSNSFFSFPTNRATRLNVRLK